MMVLVQWWSAICDTTQQAQDTEQMLVLMLAQRRRRWDNIKSTLAPLLVFVQNGRQSAIIHFQMAVIW